jgi:hypothetical protein
MVTIPQVRSSAADGERQDKRKAQRFAARLSKGVGT